MQFIGNYRDYIKQEWIDELLANQGTPRPSKGKKPESPEEEHEYDRARRAGYKDDATYFYMFDKNNVSFQLELPFINKKYHWWITKMLPGNFMPMHVDPHTLFETNSKRYWLPLQDWEPGHVFMYENQIIVNYKKGDLWTYEDSTALHGAANIGFTPRIVLQISTYE